MYRYLTIKGLMKAYEGSDLSFKRVKRTKSDGHYTIPVDVRGIFRMGNTMMEIWDKLGNRLYKIPTYVSMETGKVYYDAYYLA